ncbi:hypothetical protein ABZT26_16715 [Streptomyces sp. NPDC005395]|uniref:hypothetical protein n=1 Tax=Streptomyces sp. NPDC005395 TaxID=3157042 RepID=UPI0033A906EA
MNPRSSARSRHARISEPPTSNPGGSVAGTHRTYVFDFATNSGDGVRVVGGSGGTQTFTSIAELEVFHR